MDTQNTEKKNSNCLVVCLILGNIVVKQWELKLILCCILVAKCRFEQHQRWNKQNSWKTKMTICKSSLWVRHRFGHHDAEIISISNALRYTSDNPPTITKPPGWNSDIWSTFSAKMSLFALHDFAASTRPKNVTNRTVRKVTWNKKVIIRTVGIVTWKIDVTI